MYRFISLLFLLFPFIIFSHQSNALKNGANKTFTIGIISSKPKKRIKETTPLMEYIVKHSTEYDQGKILVIDNVKEMANLLKDGTVTMLSTTSYAALLIENQTNAKIMALRWKEGVESYHSVIFTRKNSQLNEIKELVGRTITFEKSSSTSGFFMPSIYLLNKGFKLQKMNSIKQKPDPDKIGYIFIDDHLHQSNEINMSIWVFHRRLDASAFSNLDWDDNQTTPENAKKQLRIIAETPLFPRGVILISPTLNTTSQNALLNILFTADKTKEGIKAMEKFKRTSQFSPITSSMLKLLEEARQQLLANLGIYK